ncbi:Heavy metal transport/detoxification protein [Alloactinosynnema sp. L-07]|nr:Heavy metal transport/detoxification protein [Alloactinosynnema sp. L-07]
MATTTTHVFRIEGMRCGSCALLIDDTLDDLPGVHSVQTTIRPLVHPRPREPRHRRHPPHPRRHRTPRLAPARRTRTPLTRHDPRTPTPRQPRLRLLRILDAETHHVRPVTIVGVLHRLPRRTRRPPPFPQQRRTNRHSQQFTIGLVGGNRIDQVMDKRDIDALITQIRVD